MECRGRAVLCIGLKFWCCQNVGLNPGRGASARHLFIIASSFGWDVKAVGPVCCVMHVKEPRTRIVKEKGGLPRCFWNGSKMRRKHS